MLSRAHKYCWVFIIAALAAMFRFAATESSTAHTPTTLPVEPPELVLQTGHSEKINSIAFSPDDRLLASGSSDYSVALLGLASGHEFSKLCGRAKLPPVRSGPSKIIPDGSPLLCSVPTASGWQRAAETRPFGFGI